MKSGAKVFWKGEPIFTIKSIENNAIKVLWMIGKVSGKETTINKMIFEDFINSKVWSF